KAFLLWLLIVFLAIIEAALVPHGLDLVSGAMKDRMLWIVVRLFAYLATMVWIGYAIGATFRASQTGREPRDRATWVSSSPEPAEVSIPASTPAGCTVELPIMAAHRAVLERGRRLFLVVVIGLGLMSLTVGNETERPGTGALIAVLVCAPILLILGV